MDLSASTALACFCCVVLYLVQVQQMSEPMLVVKYISAHACKLDAGSPVAQVAGQILDLGLVPAHGHLVQPLALAYARKHFV